MSALNWLKQSTDKPLFPDLIWSRPENRQAAGKLLIIGGNAYNFAAPAEAYTEAQKAGIGTARVLLPDSLKKTIGRTFEAGEFAPSTPSGSFSQKALAEFLSYAGWADGTILAGDLGRNSETAIALEAFAQKYHGRLTITKDAADYFTAAPESILDRPNTTLILSFAQTQKLATRAKFTTALTFDMSLLALVDALHAFTGTHSCNLVVKHHEFILVATQGQVSSTKLDHNPDIWRVRTAAYASVWCLQNPAKPFEALTCAVYETVSTGLAPNPATAP